MPKPPRGDDLDNVSFIVNYFVQGCVPPYTLFAEFSHAPQKDLWLLLLSPDLEDIAKAWIRPGAERKRKPARHGRKHRMRGISLDPNDLMGGKARAAAHGYPGIKLPGAKALFRLSDHLDRLNFTAAIVEGVTDVGFETLWGILSAHPEHCPNMAFLNRSSRFRESHPGILPITDPFFLDRLDSAQLFTTASPSVFSSFAGDWTLTYETTIEPYSIGGCQNWRLLVRTDQRGTIATGNAYTLGRGEQGRPNISAEVKQGEFAYVSRSSQGGSVYLDFQKLFCFGGTWL